MSRKFGIADDTQRRFEGELAMSVAGEDLRIGDDVAVLYETDELPSWLWDCDVQTHAPHEPIRTRYASRDPGVPYRVEAVCLPFVFLKSLRREHRAVDLRLVQLVRVTKHYARSVRKALRGKSPTTE